VVLPEAPGMPVGTNPEGKRKGLRLKGRRFGHIQGQDHGQVLQGAIGLEVLEKPPDQCPLAMADNGKGDGFGGGHFFKPTKENQFNNQPTLERKANKSKVKDPLWRDCPV